MNQTADGIADVILSMNIDVGRAAFTVTKALDYVGIDDKSHGLRVGLICHRIAHLLGWEKSRRHFILIAGMLHDCGVSSTTVHKKLVDEMEWEGAEEHCIRGDSFLRSFPPSVRLRLRSDITIPAGRTCLNTLIMKPASMPI